MDIASGAVISSKIANGAVTTNKIADYAVTNIKLSAGAIPYNVTSSTSFETTNSTSFIDMPFTSVNMTLKRNSTLLIMFSTEAWMTGTDPSDYAMYARAMVNTTQAHPSSSYLTLTSSSRFAGPPPVYESFSYTFYIPNVAAGTYDVKMQWRVFDGNTFGNVNERTLAVIALPE